MAVTLPYRLTITNIHDGDTITADIHLGFGVLLVSQKIRLLGIDAPELHGETKDAGMAARDALRAKLADQAVTVRCVEHDGVFKKCKYGRWLGTLFIGDESVNDWLLANGFAVVYDC